MKNSNVMISKIEFYYHIVHRGYSPDDTKNDDICNIFISFFDHIIVCLILALNPIVHELLTSHEILCKSNIMKQNNKKKDREQKLFNN